MMTASLRASATRASHSVWQFRGRGDRGNASTGVEPALAYPIALRQLQRPTGRINQSSRWLDVGGATYCFVIAARRRILTKVSILATFPGLEMIIDRSGVAVRAGTHGVTATCRASFALYNTKDEVDTLAESMVKVFRMCDDTYTVEKAATEKLATGAQPTPDGNPSALPEAELTRLTDEIVTALKTVYDPEIPADIYEIGLIYRIDIDIDRGVKIDMSLTSHGCPSAQELPVMVQNAVSTVSGVGKVDVSVVWDPPWDPSRMTDEARVVLNML
jgi:FeS assembly SUF system protein